MMNGGFFIPKKDKIIEQSIIIPINHNNHEIGHLIVSSNFKIDSYRESKLEYIPSSGDMDFNNIVKEKKLDNKTPIQYSIESDRYSNILFLEEQKYDLYFKLYEDYLYLKDDLEIFSTLDYQYKQSSTESSNQSQDEERSFTFEFNTHDNISLGNLNFKSFAGKTVLDILLKGEETPLLKIPIEVKSKKLNYYKQYPQMIADIAEYLSGLLFKVNSPLYSSFESADVDEKSIYEEYMLLEYLFRPDNLPSIFEYLSRNLYSYLEEYTERVPTTFASNIGANELANIAAFTDNVEETIEEDAIFSVDNTHYIPLEIDEIQHRDIIDIPENRFYKYFLEYIEEIIFKLLEMEEVKNMDSSEYVKENLLSFKNDIEYFLSQKYFNDISSLDYLPLNSQVLQKKEGYREILEYFLIFELGLRINCDIITDEIKGYEKRLSRLYEYWCYFKLVKIIEDFTQSDFSLEDFTEQKEEGFVLKLEGQLSKTKTIDEKDIELRLVYQSTFVSQDSNSNSEYRSESLQFNPDYTLFIKIDDEESFIHFDAKYRVTEGQKYKPEDIWKMHTYNDAIKNSLGSFVLYPGIERGLFPDNEIAHVGAFPLNPDPFSHENEKIYDLINKKIDNLLVNRR